MPYRVNSCFEDFIKYKVNLDPDRTQKARKSKNNLQANIISLAEKGDLPVLYKGMHLDYGSFARRVKLRPLNDIDMMICMDGTHGKYTEIQPDSKYTIWIDEIAPKLCEKRDADGNLNSTKVIELFKKELSQVGDFRSADLHKRGEAVTLKLKSYEWNFDILPCFYADKGFYLIPDGKGAWKKTDPRIDEARIDDAEDDIRRFHPNAKDMRTFIRLMKYWKNISWGDAISSYMFEQMVLTYIEQKGVASDWQSNVRNCLQSLSSQIIGSVADPKGMQGDLNTLELEKRYNFSAIADADVKIANKAISEEAMAGFFGGTHENAIKLWHGIFGNEFKLYGDSYE